MPKSDNFESFGLSKDLLFALKEKGFEEPTPIQKKTIPFILQNKKDIVGKAQTGTGKTAAFALPTIELIDPKLNKLQAFILTPTRELAGQIAEEINSLRGGRKLKVTAIYGGQSITQQIRRLKEGAQIVIGTPGRVLDHIKRKNLNLKDLKLLILDEADEMLNMGFIKDVEKILKTTPEEKRTLLFSATMPTKILNLAKNYMRDYEYLEVKEEKITTNLTEQIYFEVKEAEKFEALSRIIDMENDFYGLIFCRTKVDVDRVSQRLKNRGYNSEGIHGDISQSQREQIFAKFKNKKIKILVATDVAARGINVDNLTHVVNFALPQDPESYVHRIGRTGRAGKEGTAITLITPYEYRKLTFIQRITKTDITKKKLPQATEIIEAKKERIKTAIQEIIEKEKHKNLIDFSKQILEKNDPTEVVSALLQHSFAKELDEKSYNQIDNFSQSRKNFNQTSPDRNGSLVKDMVRLFVAKGSNRGTTKKSLVDYITQKAKVKGHLIDDVRVFEDFSFITVPYQESKRIIQTFKKEGKDNRPLVAKAKPRSSSFNRPRNRRFKR
jgi:ATP-dependent RNA helicase DeaD